jgi:hypothetical protein
MMNSFFRKPAGERRQSPPSLLGSFLVLWMAAFGALAQAPAVSGGGAPAMSAAQIDQLVGPIALYPDDLVGIILPGATYPLEIVQADRFLDKRKSDKNLKINDAWHDSIKSLLNYPDVVKKMSTDLDWTTALGEAVVADQGGVLEAIQRFRRKVQAAGNLKSDDKQTIVVEKEVIQVVQTNPEVIYVPQYNPSTIVVAGAYPSYSYYPAPYPVYYYPYPPGAAFATGLIWGAAVTAAWNGGHYATHYGGGNNNININRNTTVNTGNINRTAASAQGTAWKSEKQPGQVSGGSASRQGTRPGDAQGGGRAAASGDALGGDRGAQNRGDAASGSRPGAGTSDRSSAQAGDRGAQNRGDAAPGSRPSAGTSDRSSAQAGNRGAQSRGGDAFGGYGSGSDARADSSRGAASRDTMSSSGRGQSFSGGEGRAGGGRTAPSGGGGRGGRGGRR